MSSDLLSGLVVAVCGNLPRRKQEDVRRIIEDCGARFEWLASNQCTHLITTQRDVDGPAKKVRLASMIKGCHIVSVEWLDECVKKQRVERPHRFLLKPTNSRRDSGNHSVQSKKRALNPDSEDEDEDTRSRKKQRDAQGTRLKVYLDWMWDTPERDDCSVLIDQGVVWDATMLKLRKVKRDEATIFCRLQIISYPRTNSYCVGRRQGPVQGPFHVEFSHGLSMKDAKSQFEYQFKDRCGLSWNSRSSHPKRTKFVFIERWYGEESEADALVRTAKKQAAACTLSQPLQDVMNFIFNPVHYARSKVCSKAPELLLPERLTLDVVEIGNVLLQKISDLVECDETSREDFARQKYKARFEIAVADLSQRYYALIYDLGRLGQFPLKERSLILKEKTFLGKHTPKAAIGMIMQERRSQAEAHRLDRIFQWLNLKELTPVNALSDEFDILNEYLMFSVGHSHSYKYKIVNLLRIERAGEALRLKKDSAHQIDETHRRLLWHGTTCASFATILSQGLQIHTEENRPPSMFGRGIYFADMSSKSAQYCDRGTFQGQGLLLLCEVQLGLPMLECSSANYGARHDATTRGFISAMGKGTTYPGYWRDAKCVHPSLEGVLMPDMRRGNVQAVQSAVSPTLLYNEYVVWNEAQVRLRYLFHVKIF